MYELALFLNNIDNNNNNSNNDNNNPPPHLFLSSHPFSPPSSPLLSPLLIPSPPSSPFPLSHPSFPLFSLCKEGRTAYEVFQLRHYFDLEAEVTRRTKLDLTGSLGSLEVNLSEVELLSPQAEIHLNQFLNSIKIDLMPYRKEVRTEEGKGNYSI